MKSNRDKYDLIIIGGGVAASFLCLSIIKLNPQFKIVIIEKSEYFPLKIGESLVDMTALFVERLGIQHLLNEQATKTGIRFLFNENNSQDISKVSEFASPSYKGRIKSYHLNRSVFDQQLLEEVEKKGVTVLRPASIIKGVYNEFENLIDVEVGDEIRLIESRWLVDASGRTRYIPRALNWSDQEISLNTGSVMAHFKNIQEAEIWDTKKNVEWDTCAIGQRKFSTTHLMRENRWWWIIRLDDTITSIGVVFDKNKVNFDDPKSFFIEQISNDAQLSKLSLNAEISEIRHIETVPYVADKLYSKGIALIGESGAFIDPLISPGLELISQQSITLAELLVKDEREKKFNSKAWKNYNNSFLKAYASRFKMYETGYIFLESFDIYSVWLMFGNVKYFGGIVFPSILFPNKFKKPLSVNFIEQIGLDYLKRRLRKIYYKRLQQGRISQTPPNTLYYSGVRIPFGLNFYFVPIRLILKALRGYFRLEWIEIKNNFSKKQTLE